MLAPTKIAAQLRGAGVPVQNVALSDDDTTDAEIQINNQVSVTAGESYYGVNRDAGDAIVHGPTYEAVTPELPDPALQTLIREINEALETCL